MTEKGSQVEYGTGAEAQIVTGEPRSVGGPVTGGFEADPRTESPSTRPEPAPATETGDRLPDEETAPRHFDGVNIEPAGEPDLVEPQADAPSTHSYLPPVFEAQTSYAPEIDSARSMQARDGYPDQPSAPPAFTSAAYDLFFPQPSDTLPTYQSRGHRPYGKVPVASGDETEPPPLPDSKHRKARAVELFWKVARYVGYAAAGYLALVLALILLFRFVNPPASSLMLFQWLTGNSVNRTWIPINRVSPNLIRAVIVAEDGRFCDHAGIDFQAIGEAIQQATDGTPRGASTISMQVTKNMFLWSSKSYVRKIIELPLTLAMELVWPKRRILEVYLNIAEWGPGVYGAEAASRYHFRQSAAKLGERQAALLAATLPNPIVRDAGDPSTLVSRKARVIQARMRAAGSGVAACVLNRI